MIEKTTSTRDSFYMLKTTKLKLIDDEKYIISLSLITWWPNILKTMKRTFILPDHDLIGKTVSPREL